MKELIVGFGEIGKAVKEAVCSDETHIYDTKYEVRVVPSPVDVLHICFPYTEDFVEQAQGYIEESKPEHVVIWSTVPIGTCASVSLGAIHSPVEGKHPDLDLSIRQMTRWVGYNNPDEGKWSGHYFYNVGLQTKLVPSTNFTEALKLLSTTEYGLNIEFARYKKQVVDAIGMDFELTKEWNRDYNKLYKNLGMDKRFQKFVLDAPEGAKGGHCLVPNARLVYEQYPDDLVKRVAEL